MGGDDTSLQFTLKRLAVNGRVFNQDYVPVIKYDFEANSLTIIYQKSKERTRGYQEILICMGDAQEVAYFEMNDEALEHTIDLDLDSFIYVRANTEPPGAKGRLRPNRKECQFVLEFEDDKHFRELLDAIEESDLCSPYEVQPVDTEEFASSLIADSKKNYNFKRKGTLKKKDATNDDRPHSNPPEPPTQGAGNVSGRVLDDGSNVLSSSSNENPKNPPSRESKGSSDLHCGRDQQAHRDRFTQGG